MELRHLRYFNAVAEELHFGRAAARLNIAQPALSLQIRALEKELGVKLLIRSTRKVELTEAGAVFHERALAILSSVTTTCRLTQMTAGKEISRLNIGTIYPATFGILPKFLTRIDRKFPGIRITVKSDTTDNIVKEIERGNVNLGFVRPIEKISSLRYHNISSERYLLAISKDNPLLEKPRLRIGDLRDQKIIGFERSNLTYTERYFHEVFAAHGIEENVTFNCNDTLSLLSLVAAGIGVGFVPEWAEGFPKRNFALREIEGVDLRIRMGLAWSMEDPVANKDEIVEIAQSFSL